jgi:acyl-coenzyme A thioesterase PaaI-like protein
VPEAGDLDCRGLGAKSRTLREVSDEQGIVDGHGPDATHPPGPELRRLADAIRLVTDQVVRTHAGPELLAQAARVVEDAAALLEPETPAWAPSVPAAPLTQTDPHLFFPFSPMVGWYSPLAPPLDCEIRDGTLFGRARLGAAYEGPPGCVHGGIIAGLFDEVLGIANIAAGHGAMTGTLTIKYRSPTPLHQELHLEGRTDRIEGRKVFARGTLHAGERLCVEAEGVFIEVDRQRFVDHTTEHGAAAREKP